MTRRRKIAGVVGLLLIVLVVGSLLQMVVGAASETAVNVPNSEARSSAPAPTGAPAPNAYRASGSAGGEAPGQAADTDGLTYADKQVNVPGQALTERLVIKSATVEAEAEYERLGDVNRRIEQMITRVGGYIVSNDDSSSNVKNSAYATINFRVPAASFEEALRGLEGEGVTILRRDISGQDVTEEYTDNESKLRNLEATTARLRALLEQAETVTEAIEVDRTLSEYEGQIEVLKGRQKFLKDSAAMSLISFTVKAKYAAPEPVVSGWAPSRSAKRAWANLLEFGQGLADVAIELAIWTPVWLPILVVMTLVVRWLRRLFRRPAAPAVSVAPATAATSAGE